MLISHKRWSSSQVARHYTQRRIDHVPACQHGVSTPAVTAVTQRDVAAEPRPSTRPGLTWRMTPHGLRMDWQ